MIVEQNDLISRKALKEEIIQQRQAAKTSFPKRSFVVGDVLACICNAPAVEIVNVVRCEKCDHHDTDTCPENRVWCRMLRRYMKLDGYCSFGERKEE